MAWGHNSAPPTPAVSALILKEASKESVRVAASMSEPGAKSSSSTSSGATSDDIFSGISYPEPSHTGWTFDSCCSCSTCSTMSCPTASPLPSSDSHLSDLSYSGDSDTTDAEEAEGRMAPPGDQTTGNFTSLLSPEAPMGIGFRLNATPSGKLTELTPLNSSMEWSSSEEDNSIMGRFLARMNSPHPGPCAAPVKRKRKRTRRTSSEDSEVTDRATARKRLFTEEISRR